MPGLVPGIHVFIAAVAQNQEREQAFKGQRRDHARINSSDRSQRENKIVPESDLARG